MDYAHAGVEPPLKELLDDPIMRLLRRYDGLADPEPAESSALPPISAVLRAA